MTKHSEDHAEIARQYLKLTRKHYASAKHHRVYWIHLAKQYGLTWQEIGDHLGMTEGAVRRIAKLNPQPETVA